MKNLFSLWLIVLLISCSSPQSNCIEEPDQKVNCDLVQAGTFVELNGDCKVVKDKKIIFSKAYIIETNANGKEVYKAQRSLTSPCEWKAILEKNNDGTPSGSQIQAKVEKTKGDLVIVKYQVRQYAFFQAYQKVK